ncbi:transposase [Tunturiibacter lichenicola]|uniref:transposase n=1 Tax=Tunturiibacter lichenicola TaxID=2051959 RepID=UPI003D9B40DB
MTLTLHGRNEVHPRVIGRPDATHAQPRQPALERVEGSGATDRCEERGGLNRSPLPIPACQRLRHIPGNGPLVATAIVAAIGNEAAFHKGREFSSWLNALERR